MQAFLQSFRGVSEEFDRRHSTPDDPPLMFGGWLLFYDGAYRSPDVLESPHEPDYDRNLAAARDWRYAPEAALHYWTRRAARAVKEFDQMKKRLLFGAQIYPGHQMYIHPHQHEEHLAKLKALQEAALRCNQKMKDADQALEDALYALQLCRSRREREESERDRLLRAQEATGFLEGVDALEV